MPRYTVTGNLKCSFNTMLYPITCMFGYESWQEFTLVSEPYDEGGISVKERVEISAILREFPKNLSYYFAIGFGIAFTAKKLINRFKHEQN